MKKAGFTLIEVVVVVGIVIFITYLLLVNFPALRKEIALDRETTKLELSLRKAQSYALAVKEFNPSFNNDPYCDPRNSPVRFPPYGVFMSPGSDNYVLFGDINCDRKYNDGSGEDAEVINTETGVQVVSITGFDGDCSSSCALSEVFMLYKRPNPLVLLSGIDEDGLPKANLKKIEIVLSLGGTSKKLVVTPTGQITTQ